MGRRGPPKKPTALKIAQGCPGGRRKLPKNELQVDTVENVEPAFVLSENTSLYFEKITKQLQVLNILGEIDIGAISRYCDLFTKWLQLRDIISKGLIIKVETAEGTKAEANPALTPYMKISAELLKYEKEFGMTPSARANLSLIHISEPTRPY